METENSSAIINDGVSGLVEAVARTLIDGGARVGLLDLNQEFGEHVAASLGDVVMLLPVNAAEHKEVDRAVEKIRGPLWGNYPRIQRNGLADRCLFHRGPGNPKNLRHWPAALLRIPT